MNWRGGITVALLLSIMSVCLFGYVLGSQSGIFREFQAGLLSIECLLLIWIAVWCGSFIFPTFCLNDLPLICLLLIAITAYFIGYTAALLTVDAIILLTGVMLGRGARVLLMKKEEGKTQNWLGYYFLVGLVVLLSLSAWWHLDMSDNFYHGPRWMGLWDNPNIYGMLMGVGLVLAIGLLAASLKSKAQSPKLAEENSDSSSWSFLRSLRFFAAKDVFREFRDARSLSLRIFLIIAAGMMAVGLVFSYSRGAWVGTAIGLLYLAKEYGKLKWRFVLPEIIVVAAVVFCFWHYTADTDAWYVKRMDLSRPSAQHRVVAWKAGFEIMRDHPFGVGWNKTVETYQKNYSPAEDGAAAITTNDYLMLGTQLGLPGLFCFVAYVALCLGAPASCRQVGIKAEPSGETPALPTIKMACRAGALAMLVAFWFDGGLFKLATASVFWILLELGTSNLTAGRKQFCCGQVRSTSIIKGSI